MLTIGDPRGWLLLGLLALLSLLVFRKWKRKKIVLSTFFLLRRLARTLDTLPRWVRIVRRLALLLFIAAGLLIALAGFDPSYVSGRRPLRELVIVDLSPTLGVRDEGRPRLHRLRELLSEYIGHLQSEDSLYLVTAGPRAAVTPRLSGRRGAADRVRRLDYTDSPADVGGAVDLAVSLAQREEFDHVLIFTDRSSRWFEPSREERVRALSPHVVSFGRARPNAGITAFDLRRDFFRAGVYDLYLRVSCHSPDGAGGPRTFDLVVYNNGRLRERLSRECAPGESREILRRGLPLSRGGVEIRLEPPDLYPGDDAVTAGIEERGRVRVFLVTVGNLFLRDALESNLSLDLRVLDPEQSLPDDPEAVYIFDGLVPPGDFPERALFITPSRAPDNLALSSYRPAPNLVDWDRTDPAMRGVDLRALFLKGYLAVDQSSHYREIATADGRPLILLSRGERRRRAVLAFDPSRTSFVYSASYPILVANLVHWLSLLIAGEKPYLEVGNEVFLPAAARGGKVLLPRGGEIGLPGDAGRWPPFTGGSHPGRYQVVSRTGRPLGAFYLNALNPGITAEVAEPGYGREGSRLPAGLVRDPLKIEFVPWMLLAALVLLAAEGFFTHFRVSGRAGEKG